MSKTYFETALKLAENRQLVAPGAPDLETRRAAFASALASAVRRIDAVDALAAARRSGVDA